MKPKKIVFIDIETAPQTPSYNQLNEEMAGLWNEKYEQIKKRTPEKFTEDSNPVNSYSNTGLFAEFGKIICISVGFEFIRNQERHFRVKSFYQDDERELLLTFRELLLNIEKKGYQLCGHNIKEFDVPYIARRMLILNIPLPNILNLSKFKPWETPIIDTMDLWKFGDYKHYTPLKLLCTILDVESPKNDIDGSKVAYVYYEEKDIKRIATYCQNDVIATAQIYFRINGLPLLEKDKIDYIESEVGKN